MRAPTKVRNARSSCSRWPQDRPIPPPPPPGQTGPAWASGGTTRGRPGPPSRALYSGPGCGGRERARDAHRRSVRALWALPRRSGAPGARPGHWGERPHPWRTMARPPGDLPGLKDGHEASDRGHIGPRRGRVGLRRRFKRRSHTDFYAHEAPMAPLERPVGRTGDPRGQETHKQLPACSQNEHAGSRTAHS